MHAFSILSSLTLLLVSDLVRAGISVTSPSPATGCTGGQPCLTSWVSDGQVPLPSTIGNSQVGLFPFGSQQLAQPLPAVNVGISSSLTFIVNPNAGPDGLYYIGFTSTDSSYTYNSPQFPLTGMGVTSPGAPTTPTTPAGPSTPGTTPTGTPGTTPAETPTTTPAGTPGTTPADTTPATPPSGSTPTVSTPAADTTISPTSTTHAATNSTSSTTRTTTVTSSSASASAAATNAAVRVGASTSLGGIVALALLSGVLAF